MFRNTGANAFAKNQMRLAYEDKRDLYCIRDVVDRCRMWESYTDPDIVTVSKPGSDPIYPAYVIGDSDKAVEEIRVLAVTKQKSTSDQME